MLKLVRRYSILSSGYAYNHKMDTENKTVVFSHRDVVFVFNWHPDRSLPDYPIPVPEAGRYRVLMSTDDREFGGYGRIDHSVKAFSFPQVCRDPAAYPDPKPLPFGSGSEKDEPLIPLPADLSVRSACKAGPGG